MKKLIGIFFYVFLTIIIYANGQKEYNYMETVIINTDINYYNKNIQPKIILKTKEGDSNTGFKIKEGFYKDGQKIDRIVIIENITYTRYADDVTFSGNNKKDLQKSVRHIKSIINSSNFKINQKKRG